jgi:NAD+ synthase (glutamine-hydrolysing)
MHHAAIVQGIRAYVRKFGFQKVVIGLSGGIDSALVATLAVDALGRERRRHRHAVVLQQRPQCRRCARAGAEPRHRFHVLPIAPLQDAFANVLEPVFRGTEARARRGEPAVAHARHAADGVRQQARPPGADHRQQERVRGRLLHDLRRHQRRAGADRRPVEDRGLGAERWLNRDGERIPANSIEKPPSAELRPDQFDTDSLPPYPELDPVLRCLVEENCRSSDRRTHRHGARKVAELLAKVQNAEFKRYQYPPTLKVSERCWSGRRMPVIAPLPRAVAGWAQGADREWAPAAVPEVAAGRSSEPL